MHTSLFQVDLNGILKVLSDSLYSSYHVFIRELLQNSVDAINARKATEQFDPYISVSFHTTGPQRMICVEDNGSGLTLEEVDEFLSKIGSSSKSGHADRDSFIGQFGIGLLSCFMISDEVVVISRSAKNGETVKWVGNIDGTYTKTPITEAVATGTKVFLSVKDSVRLDQQLLESLLRKYGTFLEYPVRFSANDQEAGNFQRTFPWITEAAGNPSVLQLGTAVFKETFKDAIPLRDRTGKTTGVAYLLPRPTQFGSSGAHTVYIKRMFITNNCTDLLPEWAFFVRAIVNSDNLSPTASREEIYNNAALEEVREDLGACIRNYLVELSVSDPALLSRIIGTHSHALKQLALNDAEFFQFIVQWFVFPTSEGEMTIREIKQKTKNVLYIGDIDHFRQVLPVARGNGQLVVNAGYIYDMDLLDRLGATDKTALYQPIDVEYFGNILTDLGLELLDTLRDRTRELQYHLEVFSCELELKRFSPVSLPVMFFMSQESVVDRDITAIREETDDLWSGITDAVFDFNRGYLSKLFLNYDNPMARKLLESPKSGTDQLFMETLYINSMLLGHYQLNQQELDVMNNNLVQLLEKII